MLGSNLPCEKQISTIHAAICNNPCSSETVKVSDGSNTHMRNPQAIATNANQSHRRVMRSKVVTVSTLMTNSSGIPATYVKGNRMRDINRIPPEPHCRGFGADRRMECR